MSNLHHEISSIAGDTPSVFLDKETLAHRLLETLSVSLFQVFKDPVRVNGQDPSTIPSRLDFGAKLTEVKMGGSAVNGQFALENVELDFDAATQSVNLSFKKGLTISVEMGFLETHTDVAGTKTNLLEDVFSTASLIVKSLKFRLVIDNESISSASGASSVKMAYTPASDGTLSTIAADRGISVADLHRMEGTIGNGIQTMFSGFIATSHKLDFLTLFPGFSMRGRIKPYVSTDGEYLFLVPGEGIDFKPGGTTGCNGIGDGMGGFTPGTIVSQPPINPDGSISSQPGQISINPTPPAEPSTSLGRRSEGIGNIGLYLPRSTARSLLPEVIPGIRVRVGSGGTLSWQAEAFVGFTSFNFDFNPDAGAIETGIEFSIDASGYLEFDLGKILGRHRIGSFSIDQTQRNEVRVAFIPVITNTGVVIKPVIIPGTVISPFDVHVQIGRFFGMVFGSVGAFYGFVFDTVIARLVQRRLPGEIRSAIENALSRSAWTLIDVGEWADILGSTRESSVHYHALSDSLLVSAVNHEDVPSQTVGGTFPDEYG